MTHDLTPRASLGNIGMTRGDTVIHDFTVTRSREPEDIGADNLFFTAKLSTEDTDAEAVIKLSTLTTGITITSGGAGAARLTISPGDTNGLSGLLTTVLIYDLQLVKSTGEVHTLSSGSVIVQPDVSVAVA